MTIKAREIRPLVCANDSPIFANITLIMPAKLLYRPGCLQTHFPPEYDFTVGCTIFVYNAGFTGTVIWKIFENWPECHLAQVISL